MVAVQNNLSRYVSDDLVHFVGRTAVSDDGAFEWLVSIIQDGWLLTPTALAIGDRDESVANFTLNPSVKLSSNQRYIPEMICFADIPEEALHIHTGKYKRFGLGFRKRLLVKGGHGRCCTCHRRHGLSQWLSMTISAKIGMSSQTCL